MSTAKVRPEASALIGPVASQFGETVYTFGFEDYATTTYPATVVYSEGWEDGGVDDDDTRGWTAGPDSFIQRLDNGPANTGQLQVRATEDGGTGRAEYTVTGLVVGRSYTISGTFQRETTDTSSHRIGVTGIGASSASTPAQHVKTTVSYTFTATATSHQVYVSHTDTYSYDVVIWWEVSVTRNAYTEVTNTGLGGWQNFTGTTLTNVATPSPHGGARMLKVTPSASTGTKAFRRQITGLLTGRPYTLSRWGRTSNADPGTTTFAIGATTVTGSFQGGMSDPYQPGDVEGWHQITHSFIAPASTLWLYVEVGYTYSTSVMDSYIDDVTLVRSDAPLTISGGKVTVDESWSPYVQATVDVPLTDLGFLEQIDPRDTQRVTLTASETIGGSTRTFDLGLRGRTVDHKAGRVTLELASDEALLFDKRRLAGTVDKSPRTYESSLRDVCSWALGKVGAVLAPGAADADVTAQWDATNLFTNPSFEVNSAGWTAGSNTSSVTRTTGEVGAVEGTAALRWYSAAAGVSYMDSERVNVREGYIYTVSGHYVSSAARPLQIMIRLYYATGYRDILNTAVTLATGTWTRVSHTFTVPAGVTQVSVHSAYNADIAGRAIWAEAMAFTEGPVLLPYFSGATTSTSNYVYAWTGTAHASTSTRTATPERLPELFDWKPGQSLNDFLQPLIEASGLRLFCDEARVWRLVDPTDYEVDGYVVVQSAHNAIEGTDTISRNSDEWATGILVLYRWTDANGVQREEYDFAGTDDKVVTIERESEYPGPGAAAYFLNSRQGRGRVQDVTALVNLGTTPSQDVTINLPGTLTQTGKVRRVTFGLSDGLMDVGTRGLTDALPGSWATWDPEETWSEVDPTLKWKDA